MQYQEIGGQFVVVLLEGEKIISSLSEFVAQRKILSGSISGIGAVRDAKLGFYVIENKNFDEKLFREKTELVNLTGNIAWDGPKPNLHCHVTLGKEDFCAVAGHLFEAEIAIIGEFIISPGNEKTQRSNGVISSCRLTP